MVKLGRHWNREMITDHIIRKDGVEPLNYLFQVNNYPDLHAAAERLFGSWKNAIEACGFDYDDIRKYKRWSKKKVVKAIKKLHDEKKEISSNYIQNNNKPLYMASVRNFRSWGRAVKTAGIDYEKIRLRRNMTKKEIKKKILALFEKGENLSYSHMRKKYQYLLAAGSKKLGNGSWNQARKKCGIKINYRSPVERKNTLN